MKSLWKCFVQSAIVVGVSTCATTTLVAQDARQSGIMRVTQPQTRNVARGPVQQVSQAQAQGPYASAAQLPSGPPIPPAPPAPIDQNVNNQPAAVMNPAPTPPPTDGSANYTYGAWSTWPRQDLQATNWRFQDWQNSDTWGAGVRARTQAQSVAWEQTLASTPGTVTYNGPIGPVVCNNDPSGYSMVSYFKSKFGYFIPSGGNGKGIPWVGHYARVYPVNPAYSDPRDGQAYAAQGYGIPLAVPLAPVVGHTYDYGNGIPSSRLTPVSHPAN